MLKRFTLRGNQDGFTLVEFLIVLALAAGILLLVMKNSGGSIDKKNAVAMQRYLEQISSSMIKYKADIGTFPGGTFNVLWDRTAVAAASQPYWGGPYMNAPELVSGNNPVDNNLPNVIYSKGTLTATGGGAGSCANATTIGSGNASTVHVIIAAATPQDVATQLKQRLQNRFCIEDTTAATSNVYYHVDESF